METLHGWYLWIIAHWALLSTIAGAVIAVLQVVNRLTLSSEHHEGIAKVITKAIDLLSFIASKDVPTWLKWPFTTLGAKKYAMRLRQKQMRSNLGPKIGCLLALCFFASGCMTALQPRRCGAGLSALGGAPWSDADCVKAQTKRDGLLGGTIASGALGAIAGGLTGVRTDEPWRIGWGLTAGLLGAAAGILAPFLASAQKNLTEHCTDFVTPVPGQAPKLPAALLPSSRPAAP